MSYRDITPEQLRELLDYDPETGELTWQYRAEKWFASARSHKTWNTRFAGEKALTHTDHLGYKIGAVAGCAVKAHRVAWAWANGVWPEGEIDHINHVKHDNRLVNLRVVNAAENLKNRPTQRNNTSGANGVQRHKATGKWVANIGDRGRIQHLGLFSDFVDAVAARHKAEVNLGYHVNHGIGVSYGSRGKA